MLINVNSSIARMFKTISTWFLIRIDYVEIRFVQPDDDCVVFRGVSCVYLTMK